MLRILSALLIVVLAAACGGTEDADPDEAESNELIAKSDCSREWVCEPVEICDLEGNCGTVDKCHQEWVCPEG